MGGTILFEDWEAEQMKDPEFRAAVEELEGQDMWRPATLWRRYRDGQETVEVLPRWIARLRLAGIPQNEPEVERASLKI